MFAGKNYGIDDMVELAPYLEVNSKSVKGRLKDYTFAGSYDDKNESVLTNLIIMGNGMMYNHSYDPNIAYYFSEDKKDIQFVALKDIKKGDELMINYGHGWWKQRNQIPL